MAMKITAVVFASALLCTAGLEVKKAQTAVAMREDDDASCAGQKRFDEIMCKSFMCTDCLLSWCTEQCQAWQLEFPGCRCEDWPESRKSFSTGDFAGKGTFGDAGDYSKKGE